MVACAICREPCHFFGTKIEVPPKSKVKDWQKLRDWYFAGMRAFYLRRQVRGVERKHWLEREIAKEQRLVQEKQRRVHIRKLEDELRGIAV